MDNRYVVPPNRNLIVKFDTYIDVEVCNHSRAVKYHFKYIHKESVRATTTFHSTDTSLERDETKTFLDCRYISASEACWRIFQFDIHYRYPSVKRLPFHLRGEHMITFKENTNLETVIARPGVGKTKLTEWFETNQKYEGTRQLSYSTFPTEWVWNSQGKMWPRRKKGISIGRVFFTHPSAGERFYMRMLLYLVKGCTSFEDIRTVDAFTHPTYKGACYAHGLLDDDSEWIDYLEEASSWVSSYELRHLFVTILTHFQVLDALRLWNTYYEALSEDIAIMQAKRFKVNC